MTTETKQEKKPTARLVTGLKGSQKWKGSTAVYEVDPPFWGSPFAVVSQVEYGNTVGGPETGVFPATPDGDMDIAKVFVSSIIEGNEPVAFAGHDNKGALALAGYEVVEEG